MPEGVAGRMDGPEAADHFLSIFKKHIHFDRWSRRRVVSDKRLIEETVEESGRWLEARSNRLAGP